MKRLVLLALCATSLASIWAAPARAYVREESNWDPSALPVPYRVNTSSIPASLGAATGTAVHTCIKRHTHFVFDKISS